MKKANWAFIVSASNYLVKPLNIEAYSRLWGERGRRDERRWNPTRVRLANYLFYKLSPVNRDAAPLLEREPHSDKGPCTGRATDVGVR